jgi:hypothetical protein
MTDLDFRFLAHIGDTLHHVGKPVEPLPSFAPTKAMVSVQSRNH